MTNLTLYHQHVPTKVETFQTRDGDTVESIVGQWLHSKGIKSGKPDGGTIATYRTCISKFRTQLKTDGFDLIWYDASPDADDRFVQVIAKHAQIFASTRLSGSHHPGSLAPTTTNQRYAILSSFYKFVITRRFISFSNPIETCDRPKSRAYRKARAIAPSAVYEKLARIDVQTVQGARDMALLLVLLFTGRRVSEVAKLQYQDVEEYGDQVILFFKDAKGGKDFRHKLTKEVTEALQWWLIQGYGHAGNLAPHTPLWIDVAHVSSYRKPLGYQGIAGVCEHYLGTSKVHTTRHTFAVMMAELKAPLSEIQKLLGHDNPATTGGYLEALTQETNNTHADDLINLILKGKKQ